MSRLPPRPPTSTAARIAAGVNSGVGAVVGAVVGAAPQRSGACATALRRPLFTPRTRGERAPPSVRSLSAPLTSAVSERTVASLASSALKSPLLRAGVEHPRAPQRRSSATASIETSSAASCSASKGESSKMLGGASQTVSKIRVKCNGT